MDGRVRASGKGVAPFDRFAAELPPTDGGWGGMMDGFEKVGETINNLYNILLPVIHLAKLDFRTSFKRRTSVVIEQFDEPSRIVSKR